MLIEFEGKSPTIAPDVFIAPTAVLIGDVRVGRGTSIWFGAVLRADFGPIIIGERCSVQDNSVLHSFESSPTQLGDCVTVGHNVTAEGCRIGGHSLLGMGCRVLPFSSLGERVVVAANSVVLEKSEFPGGVLVAGAPATVRKTLTGRALEWTDFAISEYFDMQARYRAQGIDRLEPGKG